MYIIFSCNFLFWGSVWFQENSFTCPEAAYAFPAAMLDSRASLLSAAPMLLTKTALYLPGLCSTLLLHPTPALLLSADFGGTMGAPLPGVRRRLPQAAGRPANVPPGNLLSRDQLVLPCLLLELRLWQPSGSNPASASRQAPSLNWDVPGLRMP